MSGTCPAGVSSTIDNSLPNYIALTSGQAPCTMPCSAGNNCQSPAADCSPDSTTCNMGSTTNIVDRLENAGLTWAAYAEDYPVTSGCYTSGDTGHFAGRHFPFNYYTDITGNSARCNKLFRANSGNNGLPDDTFVNGLNASAPNFIWLTPNLCDDMHDPCSSPYNSNQIAQGNITLSILVPQILNSPLFLHTRAALFITFDEGGGSCPNAPSADDCVYTVISGPLARKSYHSSTIYMPGHYSWLSTIENNWGLACLVSVNTYNDCTASPMSEFFIPSFVMSTSPSSVSIFCNLIGCDPGHTVNSTLTITGLNGFNGFVTLSYIGPPNQVSGLMEAEPHQAPLSGQSTGAFRDSRSIPR